MARPRKQEKIKEQLKALFDGLSKKLANVSASEVSFGGVSFEDALQEVYVALLQTGFEGLPEDCLAREAVVLARATRILMGNKRRERARQKVLDRAAPNQPVECQIERILIDDENRRILTLAWTALDGRHLERELLVLLALGVDKKDTQLLVKYLNRPASKVTKAKTRVIGLLQTIVAELHDVDSNGDTQ
jgi:hypothetical protein